MMRFFQRKWCWCIAFFVLLVPAIAGASAEMPALEQLRFHAGQTADRLVFQWDALPQYTVHTEEGGKRIVFLFQHTQDATKLKPRLTSDWVQQVTILPQGDNMQVAIQLKAGAAYSVRKLSNPERIFIDIQKEYEKTSKKEISPGMTYIQYTRQDSRGPLKAYFLLVDPKNYQLRPALADGQIAGRDTVLGMARDNQALAAVNASYFALDGEILGLLQLDGKIVSTTYLTRSALGISSTGKSFIDRVAYQGSVTIGKVTVPINGVNCQRGENTLILYNSFFASSTGTNAFGREFVVHNGKVASIVQGDAAIPKDGVVISVHGTARDAFTAVQVGDPVTITEKLSDGRWGDAQQIIGAGPALVVNGKVQPTTADEKFPSDIAYGRSPRTGAGVLADGRWILGVVDGRRANLSVGCTLTEWGELFKKFGAVDAMNFDGGGSSEMVLQGKILNSPSDGNERRVGSSLVVVKK